MTVATKIEAPVKFLFPSTVDPAKQYPFSVLGLGDIVVPATFCTLMRCVVSSARLPLSALMTRVDEGRQGCILLAIR